MTNFLSSYHSIYDPNTFLVGTGIVESRNRGKITRITESEGLKITLSFRHFNRLEILRCKILLDISGPIFLHVKTIENPKADSETLNHEQMHKVVI